MFLLRCRRPEQKAASIEYHISSSQISLLLSPSELPRNTSDKYSQYSHPTLFTFSKNATLETILSNKHFINLASKHSSTAAPSTDSDQSDNTAQFQLEGKILNTNLEFSSIPLIKSLVLTINDNIQLTFHESKCLDPNFVMLDEHRKGLFYRLPIDDGQRPASSKQHVYPNESLDLLFDTLHGELTYLTEYLKSHYGKRHEFTTYPIQQQKQSAEKQWKEWETGLYKMVGDSDGTVNIALASDWGAGTL